MDYVTTWVFIYSGSCDEVHMCPSAMVVRTFNGSRREVMEEIELPIHLTGNGHTTDIYLFIDTT